MLEVLQLVFAILFRAKHSPPQALIDLIVTCIRRHHINIIRNTTSKFHVYRQKTACRLPFVRILHLLIILLFLKTLLFLHIYYIIPNNLRLVLHTHLLLLSTFVLQPLVHLVTPNTFLSVLLN